MNNVILSKQVIHAYKRKALAYLIGVITTGFAVLTIFVLLDPLSAIDKEFSEEIQEHHNKLLDELMKAISWFGYFPGSIIIVIGTSLLFLLYNYKKEALFITLTALSGLISTLVKWLVNRPRPVPDLVRVVEKTNQQSFPSGHVLFYTTFFGFLVLLMYVLKEIPKLLRVSVTSCSLLLIFSVPISRIYLGAHWFTDVIAGFFLGVLLLIAISYAYLRKGKVKK
jgi:membrane-associated phospholipid phosphatase